MIIPLNTSAPLASPDSLGAVRAAIALFLLSPCAAAAVLVDRPVAIVVQPVGADFVGHRPAGPAGVGHAVIDDPVAIVVYFVAGLDLTGIDVGVIVVAVFGRAVAVVIKIGQTVFIDKAVAIVVQMVGHITVAFDPGQYLALPQVLAVGGSWMVPRSAVASGDWAAVTAAAASSVELTRKPT